MLLQDLFEAKKTQVGIIFGRFNPPHKGHRAAWQKASEMSDIWYVGTNKSTQGPKDPLPYDVKIAAMVAIDRKSTRLNSSHIPLSRMPSSA